MPKINGTDKNTTAEIDAGAESALVGENLDHLQAVTTAAADMTAEVVDGSVISRMLSKTSDTSTYDPTTDAAEMISDKLGGFSGDGGAAQDDSTKASLDLAHTDLDAIIASIAAQDALVITERVIKTVAFDGGAGSGAVGSVAVFTVTGLVDYAVSVVCTETLVDAANLATISLGTATVTDELIDVTDCAGKNGTTIETNDLWFNNTPGAAGSVATALSSDVSKERFSMGEDIIFTIAGEAITDGTLVASIVYTKRTSGALIEAA
jgi:hypothetical protein